MRAHIVLGQGGFVVGVGLVGLLGLGAVELQGVGLLVVLLGC